MTTSLATGFSSRRSAGAGIKIVVFYIFATQQMGDGGSGAMQQGGISQKSSTVEDLAVHSQRNLHLQQIGD